EYEIEWAITFPNSGATYGTASYIVGGQQVLGNKVDTGPGTSTASSTEQLAEGDTVSFRAWRVGGGPASGVWTATYEDTPPLPPNAVEVSSLDGVYHGATLAQALYHGPTLVWGIHGTITPDPPVFLEEDPWLTLPTVEHVTYQVSGTPGAGESGTVTAVPDDGWGLDGTTTWSHEWGAPVPVVTITGTTGDRSRDQFRQACIDHGTTYQTVETLPFLRDTSQATDMRNMFRDCSSLTSVPDMDTSNVTYMYSLFQGCSSLTSVPEMDTSQVMNTQYMFFGCSALESVPDMQTSQVTIASNWIRECASLTDGSVCLIVKHSKVRTSVMIIDSRLTR